VGNSADVTFTAVPTEWFVEKRAGLPSLGSQTDWYERRRSADGCDFLRFPNLFEFMVSADGRTVALAALEHSTPESFQTYLLGHVLSYALVKQGYEPLHATAVVIGDSAIALLGPSGRGKSTLAAAFLAAGHQLLTDDLLLIRDVSGVLCGFPGPPRVKLYPHVVQEFLPSRMTSPPMNPESPKLIIPLEAHQLHGGPAPVEGFVVLDERGADDSSINLFSLSGSESVLQLLASTFNTRLVTTERLRRQFVAAREWASRIAVRRLEYPRSLTDIERVREAIVSECLSAPMRLS
jgi:hypothetical protein